VCACVCLKSIFTFIYNSLETDHSGNFENTFCHPILKCNSKPQMQYNWLNCFEMIKLLVQLMTTNVLNLFSLMITF